jgi:hypothetical protein
MVDQRMNETFITTFLGFLVFSFSFKRKYDRMKEELLLLLLLLLLVEHLASGCIGEKV